MRLINIKSKYSFYFLFFLIVFSLLSGCGSKDTSTAGTSCKVDADCSSMTCATCINSICKTKTKANCCGNNDCDAGENECSCSKDCGKCESDVDFMTKECNEEDECVSSLNSAGVSQESKDVEVKIGTNILSLTPVFDNPFLLGYSKLKIMLKADKLDDKTEFVINRIKIYDGLSSSSRVLLAEKDLNQVLYTTSSIIEEEFILEVDRNEDAEEIEEQTKDIVVEIFYDKEYIDSSGRQKSSTASLDKTIGKDMKFILLTDSACVQEECNDDNSCTRDFCKAVNGYTYCANEYITTTSCCGNKVCDSNEDKCNCPFDCGECDYDYGTYVHFACSGSNKCVAQVNDEEIEQVSKIFTSSTVPDIKFETRITYNQPFDLDEAFKIDMTLIEQDDDLKSVFIQSIQLVESSDNLLGELKFDSEGFFGVGTSKVYELSPDLLSMTEAERELKPKIVINFKYTIETQDGDEIELKKETISLDDINFVDTQ